MSKWLGLFLAVLSALIAIDSIGQDLIIESYNGPTSFDQDGEISASFTVKNTGIVDVPETTLVRCIVYLSTDSVLSNLDTYVGAESEYGAAVDESKTFSIQPGSHTRITLEPATYYMIFVVDYNNDIRETQEDNNTFVVENVTVNQRKLDFVISSMEVLNPDLLHNNQEVSLVAAIENLGLTNTIGYCYLNLYISTDNQYDETDQRVGRAYASMDGPDSVSVIFPWYERPIIPDTLQPGQYYLIGYVDAFESYIETNEQNNYLASNPFSVSAPDIDLEIVAMSGFPSWNFGEVYMSVDVQNNGTTQASRVYVSSYLSVDSVLDYQDYRVGEKELFEPIEGGDTLSESYEVSWADQVPPGDYLLISVVNEMHTITETDFDNNLIVSSWPITVTPRPVPKIAISGATMNKTVYDYSEMHFTVDLTFLNQGGHTTDGFNNIDYYFTIYDEAGDAVYLDSEYEYFYLDSLESDFSTWSIDLGDPLPAGEYTLEILSYSSISITPSYYIPFTIASPFHQVSGTVMGEDSVSITRGKVFLYKKDDTGKVEFTFKTILENDNHFSYEVDHNQHTLYFIPDPVTFSSYVPTILGKKVTLEQSCFFTATHDIDTVFEILKVQPLPSGPMSISGSVFTGTGSQTSGQSAAQRISALTGESLEGFPVILLSDEEIPVMITTTDASGHYSFNNVPEDTYGLVLALELDQPVMEEPIPVDVTEADVVVDFDVNDITVEPVTFFAQEIMLSQLLARSYGDLPFDPGAVSTSGLPLTITSSNPDVAIIELGKIKIVGVGETIITITQAGNDEYLAATPIERTLIVNKGTQHISMNQLPAKTFGDEAFEISATSSAGLPVTLSSSDETIAKIENGKVVIIGAGTVTIMAVQDGNNLYNAAEVVSRDLVINKATQQILTADLAEKTYGDAPFEIDATATSGLPVTITSSNSAVATVENNKVTIHGAGTASIWMKQEGNANIAAAPFEKRTLTVRKADLQLSVADIPEQTYGSPSFRIEISASTEGTVSVTSSNRSIATVSDGNKITIRRAGQVEITVSLDGGDNYESKTVVKPLTINKAQQGITFNEFEVMAPDQPAFKLHAMATSFLPVTFTSDNESVAVIDENNVVTIKGIGLANIVATQSGNENYSAAQPETRALRVAVITSLEQRATQLHAFPNPVTDILYLDTNLPIKHVAITDGIGKDHNNFSWEVKQVDMSKLPAGLYLIRVEDAIGTQLLKVMKE